MKYILAFISICFIAACSFESYNQREIEGQWYSESWTSSGEETGYRAERLDHLGHYWPAPGVTNEEMNIYLASGLQHDPLPQDIDEEIKVVPYSFDNLFAMAIDGRLQDAKSVVGILRAAYYLQETPFGK